MPTRFVDSTDAFQKYLEIQKVVEEFRRAEISTVYSNNKSTATFQLKCATKLFKSLDIKPESLSLPNPDVYFKVSRSTVKNVAYMSTKDIPVKKITLELDVLTGHAILSVE